MTDEEALARKRIDLVIYEGEVWKTKPVSTHMADIFKKMNSRSGLLSRIYSVLRPRQADQVHPQNQNVISKEADMTNYVMIDGKKFTLNAKQSKEILHSVQNANLGSSFLRAKKDKNYFYIGSRGTLVFETEGYGDDDERFAVANYCTDKGLMEQRALHETLSRLLWRFSESNGGRGPYSIGKDHAGGNLHVVGSSYDYLDATFVSTEVAQRAIDEVVDPFIKANPDFKW